MSLLDGLKVNQVNAAIARAYYLNLASWGIALIVGLGWRLGLYSRQTLNALALPVVGGVLVTLTIMVAAIISEDVQNKLNP